MPVNDDIVDEITLRDIRLARFTEGQRRTVFRILRDVEQEIIDHLNEEDPTEPLRSAFQERRLRRLLREVQQLLNDGYDQVHRDTRGDLVRMAIAENGQILRIVNEAVGVEVMTERIPDDRLRTLVDETLIEGAPAREWWRKQARDTRQAFHNQMRQGLVQEESLGDLVRRIRGTRARRFSDGIMAISRRSAERIVRTSVQSVANGTREAVYEKNADVIRGVQAVAVLDTRTSPICQARSGASWNIETRRPLPESPRKERYPGSTPWHWGCRTQLVPVIKSFEEMLGSKGKRLDDQLRKAGPGTQASMDGQVAGDLNFEGWLRKQTESRQVEALGRGKFELWKEGNISMTDLIDQRGRPLSVEELEAM